jgi:hypothetical protein
MREYLWMYQKSSIDPAWSKAAGIPWMYCGYSGILLWPECGLQEGAILMAEEQIWIDLSSFSLLI